MKITQTPFRRLFLAGVVTALSFPPFPLGFLAWIGLIPLIREWLSIRSVRLSGYYGLSWSLGYLFVMLYWIGLNTGTYWWAAVISMIAAVLFLSLNYLLIGWWFGWVHKAIGGTAIWFLPFIWVSVEFIRTKGVLGFPWIALANSQTDYLPLIQHAEFSGIYGISFWIVLVNILGYIVVQARQKMVPALVLGLTILAPWISGSLLIPDSPEPSFRVGIVQPNVNASDKWLPNLRHLHFAQLDSMTRVISNEKPNVVIWPEAATPAYLRYGGRGYLREIRDMLAELKISVITGFPDYDRKMDKSVLYYNGVAQLDSNGLNERYYKIQLVPFGEYIPLSNTFTALRKLNVGQGNFTAGTAFTIFHIDSVPFGVSVCYETTFPDLNRRFVRAGAHFLASVVNDAWYRTSSGPYQHASQYRYRAVEFRRPVVRAANTGVSVVYNQSGRKVASMGLNHEGVITADIAPSNELTFYTKVGDLFAWLLVIVSLGQTASVAYRGLRQRKGGRSD